jgi:hypothetical protein
MGYQDISEVINDSYGNFGYDAETTDDVTGYMIWNGTGPAPASQTFLILPDLEAAAGIFGGNDYKATAISIVTDNNFGLVSQDIVGPNNAWTYSPVPATAEFVQLTPTNNVVSYTIKSHLSASVNGGGDGGTDPTADAAEYFTMTPVGIQLGGATEDSSGNQNIIIGQQCSASVYGLNNLPAGWSASYQWNVGGSTFSSFYVSPAQYFLGFQTVPPAEQGRIVIVPPATWNLPSPTWYWWNNGTNWGTAKAYNVSVVVTLTSPGGATVTLNCAQPVQVWAPTAGMQNAQPETSSVTVTGKPNIMNLSSAPAGSAETAGMSYDVWALDPYAGLFDSPVLILEPDGPIIAYKQCGSISDVQLTDYYAYEGLGVTSTTNGSVWLDGQYPYGDTGACCNPSYYNGSGMLTFVDVPSVDIDVLANENYSTNCAFFDTILYTPPGSASIPVPVYEVDWTWITSISTDANDITTLGSPFGTAITASYYQDQFPYWSNVFIPAQSPF